MTDLHAAITARIDEKQANAERAQANAPGPWGYLAPSMEVVDLSLDPVADVNSDPIGYYLPAWDPATVLRGLAEDRDILARHRSDNDLDSQREFWECVACSHEIECNSDRYRDHNITVRWPCPDVRSLARRHGLEVPE